MSQDFKVAGAAQKRWAEGFMQQGSLPYRQDRDTIRKIFRTEPADTEHCTAGLKELFPQLNEDSLKKALVQSFEGLFGVRLEASGPTPAEADLAAQLAERKYLQASWQHLL